LGLKKTESKFTKGPKLAHVKGPFEGLHKKHIYHA